MARIAQRLIIEHDTDPDFSWLEQDHYKPGHAGYSPIYRTSADMKHGRNPIPAEWYTNPDNHVSLRMVLQEMGPSDDDWRTVDSLGGIDFLADSDEWLTGTFYYLQSLPRRSYLRQLARDIGLRNRRPTVRRSMQDALDTNAVIAAEVRAEGGYR